MPPRPPHEPRPVAAAIRATGYAASRLAGFTVGYAAIRATGYAASRLAGFTVGYAAIRLAGFTVGAAAAAALPAPPAAAAEWTAPVHGGVTRGFDLGADPFEAGRHRGADFAALEGAAVRAACGGRVVVAARVGTSGPVVTIRCGPWRVSHLPLAGVAVRPGAVVDRGERIGTAGASVQHAGLHLGVRREGDPFGYVDPLPFLAQRRHAPPPVGGRAPRAARPRPLSPPPKPHATRPRSVSPPEPRAASPRRFAAAAPAGVVAGSSPAPAGAPLAPWPAWAGLALLLAGAAGAGVRRRPRKRRAALPQAPAREVR